jgi:hypothetical protein
MVFEALKDPEGSKPGSRHPRTGLGLLDLRDPGAKLHDDFTGHVRR